MKGFLALEDGRVFQGISFGADGIAEGEVVFNTAMAGYQEILTDPSYNGQIVTMTYPLIGNYGTNKEDVESAQPRVKGFVVREFSPYPSNYRSTQPLQEYLEENAIVALSEIDTRAVTKHIREAGAMRAVIAAGDQDADELVDRAKASQGLVGRDLVCEVTCEKQYAWDQPCAWDIPEDLLVRNGNIADRLKVVAYDFGVKYNILRCLVSFGCEVTVVPASTPADKVLAIPNRLRHEESVVESFSEGEITAFLRSLELPELRETAPIKLKEFSDKIPPKVENLQVHITPQALRLDCRYAEPWLRRPVISAYISVKASGGTLQMWCQTQKKAADTINTWRSFGLESNFYSRTLSHIRI